MVGTLDQRTVALRIGHRATTRIRAHRSTGQANIVQRTARIGAQERVMGRTHRLCTSRVDQGRVEAMGAASMGRVRGAARPALASWGMARKGARVVAAEVTVEALGGESTKPECSSNVSARRFVSSPFARLQK